MPDLDLSPSPRAAAPPKVLAPVEWQRDFRKQLATAELELEVRRLHVAEGLTLAEVARQLGVSRETVYRRWRALIRQMREANSLFSPEEVDAAQAFVLGGCIEVAEHALNSLPEGAAWGAVALQALDRVWERHGCSTADPLEDRTSGLGARLAALRERAAQLSPLAAGRPAVIDEPTPSGPERLGSKPVDYEREADD